MLELTENAIKRLSYIANKAGTRYVRLAVKGGGCAGFEYDWSFTNDKEAKDEVLHNILLVHRDFFIHLYSARLDWVEDGFKAEFVITNPNAKSSCGCGTSFGI